MEREAYRTDVTDEQWEALEMLIPPAVPGGRPRETEMREVVDALFYIHRTGCQWGLLPHDFPPKSTVHYYFSKWRDDGTWQEILDVLRQAVRMSETPERDPDPSAASIDSQSVKTAEQGGPRGYDGAKKVKGRKRHIAVDTLGLLLAVCVTPADVDDAAAAPEVMSQLDQEAHPRLEVVWADSKYHNHDLHDWLARQRESSRLDWKLEIKRRPQGARGFVLIPKRWTVERTFAWQGRGRRLSKDYERRTDSSESMIRIGAIHHMLQRLTNHRPYPEFHYDVNA